MFIECFCFQTSLLQNKTKQKQKSPTTIPAPWVTQEANGLAKFYIQSPTWLASTGAQKLGPLEARARPLPTEQNSRTSLFYSAQELSCVPEKCKWLLQSKKVGHSLHHFSRFEASIPSGFICLVGAFISAARRLHEGLWTTQRGDRLGALHSNTGTSGQASAKWQRRSMKLIFGTLTQLSAPLCLGPNKSQE